jgi:hypothetical protein
MQLCTSKVDVAHWFLHDDLLHLVTRVTSAGAGGVELMRLPLAGLIARVTRQAAIDAKVLCSFQPNAGQRGRGQALRHCCRRRQTPCNSSSVTVSPAAGARCKGASVSESARSHER